MEQLFGVAPFAGFRIVDFTRMLAGPYCTALLADMGAEVIKVEPPAGGDECRQVGPFVGGESALFMLMNRGKRSVQIDLRADAGRSIAHEIIRSADVVVENYRPGVAANLKIDYESCRSLRGDIVHASVSGFGQSGPLADRPAYDLIVQAMSGLMDLTGEPGRPAQRVGDSFGDLCSGLYCAWGITAALLRRERMGGGGKVDVAMFDTLFSLLPTAFAQWMAGRQPTRAGNAHPLSAPFGAFQAREGQFALAVVNEKTFAQFCEILCQPELARDPRFSSNDLRAANEPALRTVIEAWAADKTAKEVEALLTGAGLPAGAVMSVSEAIESEQPGARSLIREVAHPVAGSQYAMEQPVHLSGLRRGETTPAPALGADRDLVLRQLLGKSDREIGTLAAAGAFGREALVEQL